MPKNMKVCRVCGKEYESCRSIKTGSAVFNWREMCCSPECGTVYFQRVNDSRSSSHKAKEKTKEKKSHPRKNELAAESMDKLVDPAAEAEEKASETFDSDVEMDCDKVEQDYMEGVFMT